MKKFAFVPVLGVVLLAGCLERTTMDAASGLRQPTMKEAEGALKRSFSNDSEVKDVKAYRVGLTDRTTGNDQYFVCGNVDRRAGFTTYNHYTNEIITRPDDIITDKYFALVFYDIPRQYYYTGRTRLVKKGYDYGGVPTLELCGPE